ncbi:MAG: peptidylprolyl isomerase [Anaerolineae bacterium]|nr:peptidylprolyl isomerase [Anaerolineae bacterium]
MSEIQATVTNDMMVSIVYTLRLDNGEIADSSDGHGPLQFVHGRGQIIPGLEKALYGMGVHEEKDVIVAPAEGYGERDPEANTTVPHDSFPPHMQPEVGMQLYVRDQLGRAMPVFVSEILDEGVTLDFNHPLAGETLHFHVKVVGVRPATPAELAPSGCSGCSSCSSSSGCSC